LSREEAARVLSTSSVLSGMERLRGVSATGQPLLYRRQTLLEVEDVRVIDRDVAMVTYTWRWAPVSENAQVEIPVGAPIRETATFTRSKRGWRVRRQH
jgi:hypothetical protein